MSQDLHLVEHAKSVIEAAVREYGEELIPAPGLSVNPALQYAETHFALAAVLLSLLEPSDPRWLSLAESRLRLWDRHGGPRTSFNAMASCLTTIVLTRSGVHHDGLINVLQDIVSSTYERRHVEYGQWSGNNMYLLQVVVDLVLLPVARGEVPTPSAVGAVADEFRRYRTPEGYFYDLPREGHQQEPQCPPTYIMKALFLLAVCQQVRPTKDFAELFLTGIEAVRPLLTCEGNFSYFGRTDNSPFSAGLTIFSLRKAAQLNQQVRDDYWSAAAQAELYYRGFPRTPGGLLECNRFGDARSESEAAYSRDPYAKIGEYSVASCAFALLGCHWFPAPAGKPSPGRPPRLESAHSQDLGIAKISGPHHEIILRTRSDVTSWDRRYLGPTVLRFAVGDSLLVGAISRTVSTDSELNPSDSDARIDRILNRLRGWYFHGLEQLDGTSVGFVPVVRHRSVDYLPYKMASFELAGSSATIRYQMLKLVVRGYGSCAVEFREQLRRRMPGSGPREFNRPIMTLTDSIECVRTVHVSKTRCLIEDVISGSLAGKQIVFSTRHFPCALVQVSGLNKEKRLTGWGSDGRQAIEVYSGQASGPEFRYSCVIEPKPHDSQS